MIISNSNSVKIANSTIDQNRDLWDKLILITGVRYPVEDNLPKGQLSQKVQEFSIVFQALIRSHGHRTLREILHAFELARDEKLFVGDEQLKLIRLLDYACICETLKAYDRYVKNELGDLIANQKLFADSAPKQQVDVEASNRSVERFFCEAWQLSLQNKIEEFRGVFLYDFLTDQNLIDLEKHEKTAIVEKAKEKFRFDKENQKKEVDLSMRRKISNMLNDLQVTEPELVLYMKRIALMEQCKKWSRNGITPEYIIGQFKF